MSSLQVANIHFESTANNRFQYVGSNTVTFSTAGTERIRIDNTGNTTFANTINVTGAATFSNTIAITGNVGIGISPVDKLNVSDGTVTFQFKPLSGSSIGYFGIRSNHALGFSTNDTERMRIDTSGNVGIGTNSPSYKLDINGSVRSALFYMDATVSEKQIQWGLPSSRFVYFFGRPSDSAFGLYDTTLTNIRWITDTSGNFTAAGNVTAYSDIKLKTNIQTIDNALDKVSMMRGVMFTRKDTGIRGTGVIAQEIQEILPEVVQEGETLSVAYGNIVGVLIEAIKELKAEIEQLKGK